MSQLQSWVRRALWDVVPRDHRESAATCVGASSSTIGFVLLGAVVLGLSLRIDAGQPVVLPGDPGAGGVWTVGAFASGPLHLGRIPPGEREAAPGAGADRARSAPRRRLRGGCAAGRDLAFLDRLEDQVVTSSTTPTRGRCRCWP